MLSDAVQTQSELQQEGQVPGLRVAEGTNLHDALVIQRMASVGAP